MESERIYQMVFEAAEDRATLNAIRNIALSDILSNYEKLEAICAAMGINKKDLSGKSGEPLT